MRNKMFTTMLVAVFATLILADAASAYYSPRMGRFLNRDPIGEKGGVNLLEFAYNDPVNRLDILGTFSYTYEDITKGTGDRSISTEIRNGRLTRLAGKTWIDKWEANIVRVACNRGWSDIFIGGCFRLDENPDSIQHVMFWWSKDSPGSREHELEHVRLFHSAHYSMGLCFKSLFARVGCRSSKRINCILKEVVPLIKMRYHMWADELNSDFDYREAPWDPQFRIDRDNARRKKEEYQQEAIANEKKCLR